MNKAVLILLLTIFSHSAISFEFCRNIFTYTPRVLTQFYYLKVAKVLRRPDAMMAFKGMVGYIWMADMYFNRDMRKTYFTVRKILGREQFQQLGWNLVK